MADWTNLPNQAVGVGGLPSGATVTALRDNPVAIAQGAAGAPRIKDAALDTTVTNAGRDWVAARAAGAAAGAVGTYAFLGQVTEATNLFGSTVAGSNLRPAGIRATTPFSNVDPTPTSHGGQDSARAGTWRCMGVIRGAVGGGGASLWLRIS